MATYAEPHEHDEDDYGPCDECFGRGYLEDWSGVEPCHVCAGTGQVLRDLDENEVAP